MSEPTKVLCGISGFLEKESRPSGTEDILWEAFSSIEHLCICRFVWNEAPFSIAKWVRRIAERFPGIEIHFLSYSYGGTTAEHVIDLLPEYKIKNSFMIDPVYRPFVKLPSVFSLWGFGTLAMGENVETCKVWRQRTSIIRGCEVVMRSKNTRYSEELLSYKHTKIDNSPMIQGEIIERLQA